VSANLAKQTGFTEADLALLWDAILSMFENDRSAARGEMNTRGLYAFRHDGPLGNAPATDLFSRIRVVGVPGVTVARKFTHYRVDIDETDFPAGVELIKLLG
jgi:CRISPR-associated protein Csd2